MGDVFLNSAYKKVTTRDVEKYRRGIIGVLNFNGDFVKRKADIIYPILGEYDQIITFKTQSQDFIKGNIKEIPYGHATGVTKYNILREHILSFI